MMMAQRGDEAARSANTQADRSKRATQLSPGAALPALCLLGSGRLNFPLAPGRFVPAGFGWLWAVWKMPYTDWAVWCTGWGGGLVPYTDWAVWCTGWGGGRVPYTDWAVWCMGWGGGLVPYMEWAVWYTGWGGGRVPYTECVVWCTGQGKSDVRM
jgi:hypothetical protein